MKNLGLLKLELIIGTLVMAMAIILLPLGIILTDVTLMTNPYIIVTILIGMLMFASVGYFCFARYYFLYRKAPDIYVEADDNFLYIHGKKEAKIPISALENATVYFELPYIYQKEFIKEFLIHIFSEEYGTIKIEIPKYGNYKLRFVPYAEATSYELINFIEKEINKQSTQVDL